MREGVRGGVVIRPVVAKPTPIGSALSIVVLLSGWVCIRSGADAASIPWTRQGERIDGSVNGAVATVRLGMGEFKHPIFALATAQFTSTMTEKS